MANSNIEEKYRNLEEAAERQPRTAEAAVSDAEDKADAAAAPPKPAPAVTNKEGRRGKRKADVVRPGPLYQIVDAIITIAGLALVGAVILYIIMIFG